MMDFGAEPLVSIAGRELPSDLTVLIDEVVIDDSSHLPDMVEVRLRDEAHDAITRAGASVGAEIEVSATPTGRTGDPLPIFRGEITSLEVDYEASVGTMAVIRGYDQSHRLLKHRRIRAFEDLSVADVVRQVAAEAGVKVGTIDGSTTPLDHVGQFNQTDWEFLQRLARETGSELTVELGELQLRPPPPSTSGPGLGDLRREGDPLQLTLGQNLRSAQARVSSAGQARKVVVRSWDYLAKETIEAEHATETTSVEIGTTPADLAGAFDVEEERFVDRPYTTQAQVDAAASAVAELVASAHVDCVGVADGTPQVRAGEAVSLALLGEPFDGKYTVTSVRHVFDEEGYRSHFEVTGRHERSTLSLTGAGAAPAVRGPVVGLVTNVRDPEALGRVRLAFPWLDDTYESWWTRIAQADAGASNRGTLFLPEVGDEVLVAFEHGDLRAPVVIGSLWNGSDEPPTGDDPVDGTSGAVQRREIRSRLGHVLVFGDDASGRSGIELTTADGQRSIHLDEQGRKLLITIGSTTLEIVDGGDVTLTSNGNMDMTATGNITIEATGNLELKGTQATVQASGVAAVKGATVQLN